MLGLRAMAGFACAVLLVLFMPIAPTDPTYSFGAARPGGAQAVLSQAAAMHPVALPCDVNGGSHDAACCMTMRQGMMAGDTTLPAPEVAERQVNLLSARLDGLKAIAAAETSLYGALSDEQKKTADDLLSAPMGRM
jgi:hypothetical protein